jgi:hypothetical protein
MKRVDDTKAKQAMLDALANYTGPITHCREAEPKLTCKLSEFGECQNQFIPADKKKWTKFCCTEHRKRWHYLNRTRTPYREVEAAEDAEARRENQLNGHANGHDVAKPKLTLADLGLVPAQPTTQSFKRRKLTTQNANASEDSTHERR